MKFGKMESIAGRGNKLCIQKFVRDPILLYHRKKEYQEMRLLFHTEEFRFR